MRGQYTSSSSPMNAWASHSPIMRPGRAPSGITPLVHLTLPENDGFGEDAEGRHFAPIIFLLEGLCNVNEWLIRRSIRRFEKGEILSPIPPLYASGVVYKEDPPGQENWKDCIEVLKDMFADCDRLCAWRVGELRAANINARPVIKWQQLPKWFCIQVMKFPANKVPERGISMVHVLVEWPNGFVEDPSKNLGMGGSFNQSV